MGAVDVTQPNGADDVSDSVEDLEESRRDVCIKVSGLPLSRTVGITGPGNWVPI